MKRLRSSLATLCLGTAVLSAQEAATKFKLADEPGNTLRVVAGDRPVLQYHYGFVSRPELKNDNFTRNAYLHPLWTPSGKVVTDDWCGKDNHWHQRGVFFAWTHTEIGGKEHDFWNLGKGTGKVFFAKFAEKFADGAGFVAEHDWKIGPGGTNTVYGDVVMRERWTVRCVEATAQRFVFDLTTRQQAVVPIKFPLYHYGGMAYRGAAEWQPKTTPLDVTTSEGHDRISGDQQCARWWHVQGELGGGTVGVAMLDAPSNRNHPSPMRLNPKIPYFGFFPFQKEEFTLQPGQSLEFTYRLVVHDGKLPREEVERLWQAWAKNRGAK